MNEKKRRKYKVSVIRIGRACHDFVVEARNQKEAMALARAEAANHDFNNEFASEYEIDHVNVEET